MTKATHIRSGHTGEIVDVIRDYDGRHRFYFEDNAVPTAAGWYFSEEFIIPGVNTDLNPGAAERRVGC